MTGIFIFLSVFIYFIPSIAAYHKKKTNAGSILLLNVLLGWTLVGWVIALIWAINKDTEPLVIHQTKPHSDADELQKLAKLKKDGVITEKEFTIKKKKLIEG